MHCAGCEKLLSDELAELPGVACVRADSRKGTLEMECSSEKLDLEAVREKVEKLGYKISKNRQDAADDERKGSWSSWLWSFLIVLLLALGFRVFQDQHIPEMIGVTSSSIDYGTAFLVGLVASVSSCLAVVGSVVIAFSEKTGTDEKGLSESVLRPNLLFQAGRLGGFFLLGGILGLIGGSLDISGSFVAAYSIIIAVVMGLLGLSILGLMPDISSFGLKLPRALSAPWDKLKKSDSPVAPLFLGALSFFLPCGFTQSMQVLAIASGSFWRGGLGMLFFALGTLPSLLALGVSTSWSRNKNTAIFSKVAGMLIIAFSFYTFNSGLALVGASGNLFSGQTEKEPVVTEATGGDHQTVEMHVTSAGFSPATIHLKKGVPVDWLVKGDSITGCTSRIVVPSLGISQDLTVGDNLIRFTPDRSGEIPFSCWMGMVRGKFVVE